MSSAEYEAFIAAVLKRFTWREWMALPLRHRLKIAANIIGSAC